MDGAIIADRVCRYGAAAVGAFDIWYFSLNSVKTVLKLTLLVIAPKYYFDFLHVYSVKVVLNELTLRVIA